MIAGLCTAGRCEFEFDYKRNIPATINDHDVTMAAKAVCEHVLGAENVKETELIMGSEDYSYFEQKVPGTFFFLGTGNPEKGTNNPHHHPRFDVDENALPAGSAMLAGFAWARLTREVLG